MRRLALHLLLVMTLVLNGMAVPWAMARMNHAGHGFAVPPVAAGAAADATAGHAHHSLPAACDDAAAAAQDPAPPCDPDGSCCDGTTCACGCVVPPALNLPALAAAAVPTGQPAFVLPARRTPPGHDTPPFRPPAA